MPFAWSAEHTSRTRTGAGELRTISSTAARTRSARGGSPLGARSGAAVASWCSASRRAVKRTSRSLCVSRGFESVPFSSILPFLPHLRLIPQPDRTLAGNTACCGSGSCEQARASPEAARAARCQSTRAARGRGGFQSGCPDSNWGPLRPERSTLPGCATPR